MSTPNLIAIPTTLHWENPPIHWSIEHSTTLTIGAGATTDLFTDPQGTHLSDTSPRLLFQPHDNFILSARVTVDFASTYDAGVLLIYANKDRWAKLCFEFSPQRQPMIVSVVNKEYSDDCNSRIVSGNQTYLRIARIDSAYTFHTSDDGIYWHLIRYFTLGEIENTAAGFSTQSPTGQSCTATFDEIHYEARKLGDIRSGE